MIVCVAGNLMFALSAIAEDTSKPEKIRVATFNCSLNRNKSGELLSDLQSGGHKQARDVAAFLRTVRPDDKGIAGGLPSDASSVILGAQNADPHDGNSFRGAIDLLLKHARLDASHIPVSAGGVAAAKMQGKINNKHKGDPSHDTSDFSDGSVGNLRGTMFFPVEVWMCVPHMCSGRSRANPVRNSWSVRTIDSCGAI